VRIVWLRAAERNLEEQIEYIGQRNPRAPNTLADKIAATVASLADHPRRGHPGRIAGTRELLVPGTPYIVVYKGWASDHPEQQRERDPSAHQQRRGLR
jgi:toxin ParE1/3/4